MQRSREETNMPVTHSTREASVDEIAAEMDRRGAVIEKLEAERDRYLEALRDIDAVGVDFGHFESAARTMQAHASKALTGSQEPAFTKAPDETSAALISIVEGVKGTMEHGTWLDKNGMRLKDTPEWVEFYVRHSSTTPHKTA